MGIIVRMENGQILSAGIKAESESILEVQNHEALNMTGEPVGDCTQTTRSLPQWLNPMRLSNGQLLPV
jgi:hypothetical protein